MSAVPSYEIVIPSASRPKILGAALTSLLARVDVLPKRVLIHDDVVKPEYRNDVRDVAAAICQSQNIPFYFEQHEPPLSHGPSLHCLLAAAKTAYVLYSQDDLFVRRDLPIARALQTMERHSLHQIRFNKRATMEYKMSWRKKEFQFEMPDAPVTLTVADHWYFQTGLWRVARIKPVVDWWVMTSNAFNEHCEIKCNKSMNRDIAEFNHWALATGYELPEQAYLSSDVDVRAAVHKTFIWGPIGTDQFVENLATNPADWRLVRSRGGTGPPEVDSQARGGNEQTHV